MAKREKKRERETCPLTVKMGRQKACDWCFEWVMTDKSRNQLLSTAFGLQSP